MTVCLPLAPLFLLMPFVACNAASNSPSPTEAPVESALPTPVEKLNPVQSPGVKATGELPEQAGSEGGAEEALRQKCTEDCIQARQMEAVAIEMIEESCRQGCIGEGPLMQLESVSDPAPAGTDQ